MIGPPIKELNPFNSARCNDNFQLPRCKGCLYSVKIPNFSLDLALGIFQIADVRRWRGGSEVGVRHRRRCYLKGIFPPAPAVFEDSSIAVVFSAPRTQKMFAVTNLGGQGGRDTPIRVRSISMRPVQVAQRSQGAFYRAAGEGGAKKRSMSAMVCSMSAVSSGCSTRSTSKFPRFLRRVGRC